MSMITVKIHGKAFSDLVTIQAYLELQEGRPIFVGEILEMLLRMAVKSVEQQHSEQIQKAIYESRKDEQHSDYKRPSRNGEAE
jgi:hypothetical protein